MTLTVRLESSEEFWASTRKVFRKLDCKEPIEEEDSISVESLDELLTFLTRERLRLLRASRVKRLSISALAEELGRDRKSVSRDVKALASLGIVRIRKEVNPGHGLIGIVEPVADKLDVRISI